MTEQQIDQALKAIASAPRRKILQIISENAPQPYQACTDQSICACELAKRLDLSAATISHHMKTLQNAGLVKGTKDGLWVNYSLEIKNIEQLCETMHSVLGIACDVEEHA